MEEEEEEADEGEARVRVTVGPKQFDLKWKQTENKGTHVQEAIVQKLCGSGQSHFHRS